MKPYSTDFDVAIDILATYSGALERAIDRLEKEPDAHIEEIAAYAKELKRVENELHTMRPDDQELVNKANFIYSKLSRQLMQENLNGGAGAS